MTKPGTIEIEATAAAAPVAATKTSGSRGPERAWIPGIDGLRAVAILLVLAFHLAPDLVRGGFVGVDVFFVISGFLITTGLVREKARTGRIALGTFWAKRARRLLPALSVVLVVSASAALFVGGDVRVDLDRQVFGAMTFSSNWVSIAGEDSYFAGLSPQLFANLWSLAVEEQFYLLWPFVALLVMRLRRPRGDRVGFALAAAAMSAAAMAWLWSPDTDPTRVYYGTDTHLFGLMLGVALAFWHARGRQVGADRPTLVPDPRIVAGGAFAVLGLLTVVLPWASPWTYRGGLVLASVCSAAIMAALLRTSTVHRWLEWPFLVWTGRRSYGLYLWHWPVFVLLTQIFAKQYVEGTGVYLVWVLTIVVTFVLAAATYRWVEAPVLRHGFGGAARALGAWATVPRDAADPSGHRKLRTRGALVAALVAVTVILSASAVATAPAVSAIEEQIAEGIDVAAQAAPTTAQPPSPEAAGGPDASAPPSSAPSSSPPTDEPTATPAPAPVPRTGADVTIIGDSVTLASAEAITRLLPDAAIDAEVSRSMLVAPGIIQSLASKGQLRDVVVLSLATNTTLKESQVADVMDAVGPGRAVVFVNAYGNRSWIKGTNRTLDRAAEDYPNATVADWRSAIADHGEGLAADGVHPNQTGAKVYAKVLAAAYERLAD